MGYKINCGKSGGFLSANCTGRTPNDTLSFVLSGLRKYTRYCVSVLAYTNDGDGKTSECVSVVTDEDGELFCINVEWSHLRLAERCLLKKLSQY